MYMEKKTENPINYWYQKYLKEKLTWQDVKNIVTIADSMLTCTAWDDVDWPDKQQFYEEVLRTYNKMKDGQ